MALMINLSVPGYGNVIGENFHCQRDLIVFVNIINSPHCIKPAQ